MAATKTPIAPDSAAELHDLIGDDSTATFENDPKFIDSDPTDHASSENIEEQRDTDDTEDSEEEEDELEDEDDDELEDDDEDELEDEDDDQDEEEEEEVGTTIILVTGPVELREAEVSGSTSAEPALEEGDNAGDKVVDEDTAGGDSAETDRAIDAALRMNALVTVTSEFAANV